MVLLLDLTDDLVFYLLTFLSPNECAALSHLCWRFYHLAGDNLLWKHYCYRTFFMLGTVAILFLLGDHWSLSALLGAPVEEVDWKSEYVFMASHWKDIQLNTLAESPTNKIAVREDGLCAIVNGKITTGYVSSVLVYYLLSTRPDSSSNRSLETTSIWNPQYWLLWSHDRTTWWELVFWDILSIVVSHFLCPAVWHLVSASKDSVRECQVDNRNEWERFGPWLMRSNRMGKVLLWISWRWWWIV